MRIETALVLFNRDLRMHDNPALAAAARAERTAPLFVFDEALLRSQFAAPNRVAFMLEALADLDERLRKAGGRLFVREGDPVREALAVARQCGATQLHVSADWSAYARGREERLRRACEEQRIEFVAHPGVTVVPPGSVTPTGGDHFKVFSPYHRAWSGLPWRQVATTPRKVWPRRLRCRGATTGHGATAGRNRGGRSRPGRRARRVSPWSMRRCGSWSRRGSCTTGRG